MLIERNGCKFGCLSTSEFRICSEARFSIVEKILLSNEEPLVSKTSVIPFDNPILRIPLGRNPSCPPDEIHHLSFGDLV